MLSGTCGQHYCAECFTKFGLLTEDMIFLPNMDLGVRLRQAFRLPRIIIPQHRDQCSHFQQQDVPFGALHAHPLASAFLDATLATAGVNLSTDARGGFYTAILNRISSMQDARDLPGVVGTLDIIIQRLDSAKRHMSLPSTATPLRLNPRAPIFMPRRINQELGIRQGSGNQSGHRFRSSARTAPVRGPMQPMSMDHRAILLQRATHLRIAVANVDQAIADIQQQLARLEHPRRYQ